MKPKAITSPRKANRLKTLKRETAKPKKRIVQVAVNFEAQSILFNIQKHLDQLPKVDALKADVAVLASHVERLLAEKELCMKVIADLEASQGGGAHTVWNKAMQSWELLP